MATVRQNRNPTKSASRLQTQPSLTLALSRRERELLARRGRKAGVESGSARLFFISYSERSKAWQRLARWAAPRGKRGFDFQAFDFSRRQGARSQESGVRSASGGLLSPDYRGRDGPFGPPPAQTRT
jgi:hypothetical protein